MCYCQHKYVLFDKIKRGGEMKHKSTYKYQRIRDIREDKDLTQKDIAEQLNLYLNTYRRYETGEKTIPVNILKKLSKFYKVSMDYLTEIEEEIITKE